MASSSTRTTDGSDRTHHGTTPVQKAAMSASMLSNRAHDNSYDRR
jgi:hypothetical protein